MTKKDNSYRVPEGFDPFTRMDTIRGLFDAVHHHMTEGPGVEREPDRGARAGLISLIDQLQHHVHQLHDYLIEIENSNTLELPMPDPDFESLHVSNKDGVREDPASTWSASPDEFRNDKAPQERGFFRSTQGARRDPKSHSWAVNSGSE